MICLEEYGVEKPDIHGIVLGLNKSYRVLAMLNIDEKAKIPAVFGANRDKIFFCEAASYPEIGLVIVWSSGYQDYCFSHIQSSYTADVRGIKKFLDDWKTELYGTSA